MCGPAAKSMLLCKVLSVTVKRKIYTTVVMTVYLLIGLYI